MATAVVWDISIRAHRRLSWRLSQHALCSGVSTVTTRGSRRSFQSSTKQIKPRVPGIAFAFDIDGVLQRSAIPLPGAHKTLSHLQKNKIPFILLTNGGGKYEADRIAELSRRLNVPLDVGMFVQSHTPFCDLVEGEQGYRDKCILVIGGDGNNCRQVAENYGFRNVVIPADIITAHPSIWPFSKALAPHYATFARPLPRPIVSSDPSSGLKIDAVFVYNDPRDWGLDATILLDVLLSSQGILGTISDKNNIAELPNRGFLQDGQPPLFYSNPDLWWASAYHLPRLGQAGFREAMEGIWAAATGGPAKGVELRKIIIGKPYRLTYEFAEKKLHEHRTKLLVGDETNGEFNPLKKIFMIGDNPESDIRGANEFKSPRNSEWVSILVKTGIYKGGQPSYTPQACKDDVWSAVNWALESSGLHTID